MSDHRQGLGKNESSPNPSVDDTLLSRRRLMGGAIAGLGAMGALAQGKEQKTGDTKMPVWSGDLSKEDKQPRIPKSSKSNGLNIIVIIADTWRADHLGCYGNKRVKTPYLDEFAKKSVLFTNAHAEGLPTIPSRRVYHTGKSVLPVAAWKPLADSDVTFAEILKEKGLTTGFIVDTYHHFKPGYNFHRGFDSWQWIRGQETDKWKSGPADGLDPKKHIPAHMWNKKYDRNVRQFLLNTQDRKGEEDYFCARSCRTAMDWLEQNTGNSPFMLWLDMFDPHEPWDAPPRFQKMYRDEYPCERYLFAYGIKHGDVRPEDYPVIQDLYAAEVTFSDYCIGRLLKRVEEMGLMDNTIIVFSTDHGTHLGEQGCVQKRPILLNRCVTHLPLIIKHPDNQFAGRRVDGLVSAVDYMPTFLNLLGIDDYTNVDGHNMWRLATGEAHHNHVDVFTVFARFGAVHNMLWHYFQNIKGDDPGKGPCLYDLRNDPEQSTNVLEIYPDELDLTSIFWLRRRLPASRKLRHIPQYAYIFVPCQPCPHRRS